MATTKKIEKFKYDPKGYKVGDTVIFKNEDGTREIGEIVDMIEHLKTANKGSMVGDQLAKIKRENGTPCHKFKHEIIKKLTKIAK